MNPRVTTTVIGVLTTVMGALALTYPELVMRHVLGFAVDPAYPANFVRGEVRAAYGGMVTVVGIYTVLAATDPATNRGRILMIGLIWLGACLGRLYGVVVDGTPGAWGWISAAFETMTSMPPGNPRPRGSSLDSLTSALTSPLLLTVTSPFTGPAVSSKPPASSPGLASVL